MRSAASLSRGKCVLRAANTESVNDAQVDRAWLPGFALGTFDANYEKAVEFGPSNAALETKRTGM